MLQDLAALAPSAIVCAGFLIGAWMLIRRELGPKRRAREAAEAAEDRVERERAVQGRVDQQQGRS